MGFLVTADNNFINSGERIKTKRDRDFDNGARDS